MTYEHDLAWAAGFLDGEGCFCIRERWSHKNRAPSYKGGLSAVQVHKTPLLKLKSLFGGRIHIHGKESGNRSQSFVWNAVKTAGVLSSLIPHLVGKKQEAKILLNLLDLQKTRWFRYRTHFEVELDKWYCDRLRTERLSYRHPLPQI